MTLIRCGLLLVNFHTAATIATRQECTGGFSNKWALEHTNDNTTEVPGIMCFAGHGNPDDPYTTVGQDQCVAFCNSCAARLNTVVGAFNYVPTGGCRCYSEEQAREMRIAPDNTWQCTHAWVPRSCPPRTPAPAGPPSIDPTLLDRALRVRASSDSSPTACTPDTPR